MSETLSAYAITITLPEGWYGEIFREWTEIEDGCPTLHLGNTPLVLGDRNTYCSDVRQTLRASDVVATVVNFPSLPQIIAGSPADKLSPGEPWSIAGASAIPFHGVGNGRSSLRKAIHVGPRVFDLVAFFGTAEPTSALVDQLEQGLASMRVELTPRERDERIDQYFNVDAAVRIDAEVRAQVWERDRPHASPEELEERQAAFGG
jgi:hypothetical protein